MSMHISYKQLSVELDSLRYVATVTWLIASCNNDSVVGCGQFVDHCLHVCVLINHLKIFVATDKKFIMMFNE